MYISSVKKSKNLIYMCFFISYRFEKENIPCSIYCFCAHSIINFICLTKMKKNEKKQLYYELLKPHIKVYITRWSLVSIFLVRFNFFSLIILQLTHNVLHLFCICYIENILVLLGRPWCKVNSSFVFPYMLNV